MVEEEPRQKVAESGETMQIGKSRPPLPLTDLPEPEEVFKIKGRIGPKQLFLYVLGPSMIALGVSIGSGEWLVGPRTVGGSSTGFIGIGGIVLVSALLQVFFNVEVGGFTLSTGEAPVVAFGRVAPRLPAAGHERDESRRAGGLHCIRFRPEFRPYQLLSRQRVWDG